MAERVQDHPDYPDIFQQARDEVWGEHRDRYQRLIADGRAPAADALVARVDQQARQRAAVATQALRRVSNGEFDRLVPPLRTMEAPTLTGRENREAPLPAIPDTVAAIARDPGGALQSAAGGLADPMGLVPRPPARVETMPVQTLTGNETLEAQQFVPRWGGDEDQSAARLAGSVAGVGPFVRGAGGVVDRAVEGIARYPGTATAAAASTAMVAAPAQTQAPDPRSGIDAAQRALDQLMTSQTELSERQKALRQDLTRFESLRDSDRDAVREAQQFLAARGYNVGRRGADGNMGLETRAALQDYRRSLEGQLSEVGGQLNTMAPNLQAAQTALTAARRAAEVEEGNERLRAMESDVPPHRRMLREYGPGMGYALGLLGLGPLTRWGVTAGANRSTAATAARADDLMTQAGSGSVPGRVGRVNQFWAEGNPRRAEPFTSTPGRRPYPYTANPEAPAAGALYQPSVATARIENAGVAALGAADYALANLVLIPRASDELRQARDAVNQEPTEANIRRLQAALDMAAIYSTVGNAGLPMIAGYAGASHFMPRSHTRPNVSAADAERGLLDRVISPNAPAAAATRARPAPGATPPPGSIWNETTQRWMGPAVPGQAGRPFLSGDYAPPRRRRSSE